MKNIDDIVASIRKCIAAAQDNYFSDKKGFVEDFIRQDAAILNIQRSCEQAIELANHVVKLLKLGVANESRDSFLLLYKNNIIPRHC